MSFGINQFKTSLSGGGARPALFKVDIDFPEFAKGLPDSVYDLEGPEATVQNKVVGNPHSFFIKTASLPASTIGTYDILFHGKQVKIAGDRSFETWDTTIINDEDFGVRSKLERWMGMIQNHDLNTRSNNYRDKTSVVPTPAEGTEAGYKKDISVKQFSKTGGSSIREYKFYGAFPTSLGAIPLDWGSTDIEEFTCTWTYDYWKVV